MKITASDAAPFELATPLLITPLFADDLSGTAAELDAQLNGLIAEILAEDGFKAKAGESRLLHTPNASAKRTLLVGLGKRDKFSISTLRRAASKAVQAAASLHKTEFAFVLPEFEGISGAEAAHAVAEALELGDHKFDDFKTADKDAPVESATILVSSDAAGAQSAVEAAAFSSAANLRTRALVNQPSNLKKPETIAQAARDIAEESGLRVEVWDEQRILEEKMGALYAVGVGSDSKPRFIVMEYAPIGTENDAPIALVGKGMSFDSGGYSIKPSTGMEDMKDDMAGAGVVLGVMSALRDLGVKKRVLGIVASAENMISGDAMRPGDIIAARNGKTIEILNTDAEGRLILADALCYASEQKPELIIDFATLTGAIGIALGQEAAGLFSNSNDLSAALVQAGENVGERLWRLPTWEEYREPMKGTVSDLKNISGDRYAGSIVAATFLEEFVSEGIPWAHLDIATVSLVKKEKFMTKYGATGFGVRLILDYLQL